jgi:hypothetical protein
MQQQQRCLVPGIGCFLVDRKYTQSEIGDLIELGGEGISSKCVGHGSRKGAQGKQWRSKPTRSKDSS